MDVNVITFFQFLLFILEKTWRILEYILVYDVDPRCLKE